ncbi:MAG TPA: molybdenum cofactor guanylyltransferase [Acidobacteriota bacterium]|nr:molybdenum cofactor guanylyltransferase [Acidobacteriota bacterium]
MFSASQANEIRGSQILDRGTTRAVAAVIAGGQSARMGADKSALLLGDRRLAMWSARALSAVCKTRVQLGGSAIPELRWPLLADLRSGCGPAGGIETGLATFPGAALVVCAVDLPFVPTALLADLLSRLASGSLAAAPWHDDRWHPLCAAYSPAFLPPLRDWLDAGQRDLQRLLDRVGAVQVRDAELSAFGDPLTVLHNVNTPDDLEAARARVSGAKLP